MWPLTKWKFCWLRLVKILYLDCCMCFILLFFIIIKIMGLGFLFVLWLNLIIYWFFVIKFLILSLKIFFFLVLFKIIIFIIFCFTHFNNLLKLNEWRRKHHWNRSPWRFIIRVKTKKTCISNTQCYLTLSGNQSDLS